MGISGASPLTMDDVLDLSSSHIQLPHKDKTTRSNSVFLVTLSIEGE